MDERILNIEGWMSLNELNWLFESAVQVSKGGLIIEIGAWKGRSTAVLYTAAGNDKAVVTIDTWLGEPDLRTTIYREAMERDVFNVFMDNMRIFGINPKWYKRGALGAQYLRMDSVEASSLFDDESVDMLFIDGDHARADKDIDAWSHKIKPGGIISGHDWHWECVQEAVSNRFIIDNVIDTIWVKIKI